MVASLAGRTAAGDHQRHRRGLSFECDPELPSGTILAADSRAYTPYEKGPIQVEALNIPNGGIDLGVFSYIAAIVNDPRAVLKVVNTAGK